jgi:DNA-binding LytR/AlgR family response regulator
MNCILIDDEPLARMGIKRCLSELHYVTIQTEFSDPTEAYKYLQTHKTDLVFLDIQMPALNGIEFLKHLKVKPMAIIITAFKDYAIDGYDLDVVDYVLKPYRKERLVKAVNKAYEMFVLNRNFELRTVSPIDYLFVKNSGIYEKVFLSDIFYIQGLQNYVIIETQKKKLITYLTLSSIEEFLPSKLFLKVNRSYIVSIEKIESFNNNYVFINNQNIAISRQNKGRILNELCRNRVVKRL